MSFSVAGNGSNFVLSFQKNSFFWLGDGLDASQRLADGINCSLPNINMPRTPCHHLPSLGWVLSSSVFKEPARDVSLPINRKIRANARRRGSQGPNGMNGGTSILSLCFDLAFSLALGLEGRAGSGFDHRTPCHIAWHHALASRNQCDTIGRYGTGGGFWGVSSRRKDLKEATWSREADTPPDRRRCLLDITK